MSKRTLTLAAAALCTLSGVAYVGVRPLLEQGSGTSGAPHSPENPAERAMICTGIVEAVDGEVDVCAQIAGELAEVRFREGDRVEKGQVLAVIDARRETAELAIARASLALAKAKLVRTQAGPGQEERDEALLAVQSVEALLKYEQANVVRLRTLYETKAAPFEKLDQAQQQVEHLTKRAESLRKHYAALQRGPIPEEVAAARAEVTLAEEQLRRATVAYEYREVRAPFAGRIVAMHRHAGDTVLLEEMTPILRMIDTERLRIRIEVDEADAPSVRPGMEGIFEVRGREKPAGRLKVQTVLPQFGPKRLFNPDTSARLDTRILHVLCEVQGAEIPLYPGQRLTAHIRLADGPR